MTSAQRAKARILARKLSEKKSHRHITMYFREVVAYEKLH